MEYTTLGKTDIKVSPICLGGMQFGIAQPGFHQWVVGQPDVKDIIKRCIEQGINFFDTANSYSKGTSEQLIGESLRELGIDREKVVIASKVYFNECGLKREAILREIDQTLRNLGTDYLDLYIIHRFDYDVPMEEVMGTLHSLVEAGKVRTLGASEMYAYQLHNLQVVAEQNGWTKFSVLQPHYNLIYRENERELLPVARQYDMAVTPYSPLAAGHLTRPTWEGTSRRAETDHVARDKYDNARDNNMEIVARQKEIADKYGVPMADIALAWLWAKGVTAPVVGCNRPSRVDDVVRALNVRLTAEDVAYLDEPYKAHEQIGLIGRPGEKPSVGVMTSLKS